MPQPLQMRWGSTSIPVRRWRRYTDEGHLLEPEEGNSEPAPDGLWDPAAFYAYMAGHSMAREYISSGHYCLISPNTPLDAGQRVWFRSGDDREVIRRLVAIDADAYNLDGWREPDTLRGGDQDPVHERWLRADVAAKGVVLAVYAHSPAQTPEPFQVPDVAGGRAAARPRAIPVANPELAALLAALVDHHDALNEYGRAHLVAAIKHHFPNLESR